MSEAFYKTASDLAVKFVILLVSILIGIQLVFFYIVYGYYGFYLSYLTVLFFSFVYGTKIYRDYQHFRELISQGLMFPQPKQDMETLTISAEELNDKGLQACLLYHQGVGYKDIGIKMNAGKYHAQTVRRLIRRGLRILIEDYQLHNQNREDIFLS